MSIHPEVESCSDLERVLVLYDPSAWYGWYAQAAGLKKIVQRMLNRVLSEAFERWEEDVIEAIEIVGPHTA